jgi:hypothetical protein
MKTQSIHDNDEWSRLVPAAVSRIKATDGNKDPQKHSIESLLAGYIGDEKRWTVGIKYIEVQHGNRW